MPGKKKHSENKQDPLYKLLQGDDYIKDYDPETGSFTAPDAMGDYEIPASRLMREELSQEDLKVDAMLRHIMDSHMLPAVKDVYITGDCIIDGLDIQAATVADAMPQLKKAVTAALQVLYTESRKLAAAGRPVGAQQVTSYGTVLRRVAGKSGKGHTHTGAVHIAMSGVIKNATIDIACGDETAEDMRKILVKTLLEALGDFEQWIVGNNKTVTPDLARKTVKNTTAGVRVHPLVTSAPHAPVANFNTGVDLLGLVPRPATDNTGNPQAIIDAHIKRMADNKLLQQSRPLVKNNNKNAFRDLQVKKDVIPVTDELKEVVVIEKIKKQSNSQATISTVEYEKIAAKLGIDPAVARAVAEVESGGGGFTKDGQVKVRFEGHKFRKYLSDHHYSQEQINELEKDGYSDVIYKYEHSSGKPHGYEGYNHAKSLNDQGAKSSTSFGAFQILGSNYKSAGYNSIDEFVNAQSTFSGQVEAFITFISNNKTKLNALKNKDFATFAYHYNGKNYKDNEYDTKLLTAYQKYKSK